MTLNSSFCRRAKKCFLAVDWIGRQGNAVQGYNTEQIQSRLPGAVDPTLWSQQGNRAKRSKRVLETACRRTGRLKGSRSRQLRQGSTRWRSWGRRVDWRTASSCETGPTLNPPGTYSQDWRPRPACAHKVGVPTRASELRCMNSRPGPGLRGFQK